MTPCTAGRFSLVVSCWDEMVFSNAFIAVSKKPILVPSLHAGTTVFRWRAAAGGSQRRLMKCWVTNEWDHARTYARVQGDVSFGYRFKNTCKNIHSRTHRRREEVEEKEGVFEYTLM